MKTECTKATANVLRHDDPEKVWYTQGELSGSLKEMRQLQHCDEGVLQTMISEILLDGAGPKSGLCYRIAVKDPLPWLQLRWLSREKAIRMLR